MTSKKRKARNGGATNRRRKPVTGKHGSGRLSRSTWALLLLAVVVVAGALLYSYRGTVPSFSETRAFSYLSRIDAFGPRTPGSAAHASAANWMVSELGRFADQVSRQEVIVPVPGDTLRGTNIIASFNLHPKKESRLMLSTHWDTRPWADQDPDSSSHSIAVPGSNDGGSGVAILFEIAQVLHEHPLDIGVDLIFFDLEDSGQDLTVAFALGSEFFAAHRPEYRPAFGINIDMVCDSSLTISKEANSVRGARQIVDLIWEAAEREGADAFIDRVGTAVFDDHIAFLQRGIRVVDLIQTPFPPSWHTLDDTIDKCSSRSMGQVGKTLLRVLYTD